MDQETGIKSIKEKNWELVCKSVLEYYDKCYEFEKIGKGNIELLDLTDIEYNKKIIGLIKNLI